MANRYANLVGTDKIKDSYTQINNGFDAVQTDRDNLPIGLFRNAIINGNFDIWQRGTSFTNPANGAYTADRWSVGYNGTGQVATVSQQTFTPGQGIVPNEPKYFLRYQVTTAATGQSVNAILQKIESVRTLAGSKATLSFWAKADAARTITPRIFQNFGSGGSGSVGIVGPTLNLTTSWQKFTVTFDIPSISGKTVGTSDFLSVELWMSIGTVMTIDIAQVQLCAGDVALPFQPRSVGEELQLCQRYFESNRFGDAGMTMGFAEANNYINFSFLYKVTKRVTPTIKVYSKLSTPNVMNQATVGRPEVTGANTISFATPEGGFVITDNIATAGQWYVCNWEADAEL